MFEVWIGLAITKNIHIPIGTETMWDVCAVQKPDEVWCQGMATSNTRIDAQKYPVNVSSEITVIM